MAKPPRYGSDLTEQEWQRLMPLLPLDKIFGRWRTTNLREILNTIFYRADNGAKWRNLPKDFPHGRQLLPIASP